VLYQPDPDGVAIEQLFTAVEAHAHRKAQSLERYLQLAERSQDPVTTLIVRLIVGNEESQRRLLRQLALTLRDQFNWTQSPDDLPNGPPTTGPIDPDLKRIVHQTASGDYRSEGVLCHTRLHERSGKAASKVAV